VRGAGSIRHYHADVNAFGSRLRHGRQVAVAEAPTTATVRADAQPYFGGSGPNGVLLCHGFSGSPRSMRPWAEHLAADGFRVVLPRLPGHGTTWQELNQTRWEDWYGEVDRAFTNLRAQCERVFTCGLSMGGALAIRIAEQHGPAVAGIAVVNPAIASTDLRIRALPVLRHLVPSLAGIGSDIAMPGVPEGAYDRSALHAGWSVTRMWRDIKNNLDRVDQPLLIFKSVKDRVVDELSLKLIKAGVSSRELTVVSLERSYHVATLDYDAELIFTTSSAFFRRLAGEEHERVART
jgi:carboxylesterase